MNIKQIIGLVGGLVAVSVIAYIGWILISPLFINQTVDEPFPVSIPTQEVATAEETTTDSDEPAQEAAPTEETTIMEEAEKPADEMEETDEAMEASDEEEQETEEATAEPTEEAAAEPAAEPTEEPAPEPQPTEVPTTPQILASGNIYPLDYEGEGQAALYRQPDGSHLLRLENLNVENGPDLRVYLVGIDPVPISVGSDAIAGYADLGALKGNVGNQNYEIPNNIEVSQFKSLVIWCNAFSVPFVAAPLTPVSAMQDQDQDAPQTQTVTPAAALGIDLPDMGLAPEISNEVWINSENALQLADLRGEVVMVEFWTYDCYNCQNVLPNLKQWYETYNKDGFTIVSIHYPEFNYEHEYNNVLDAVNRFEIDYPVALDNDGTTWRAYKQRYWPTMYLLDKNGHIRYKRIGEGAYEETEAVIQTLLQEAGPNT